MGGNWKVAQYGEAGWMGKDRVITHHYGEAEWGRNRKVAQYKGGWGRLGSSSYMAMPNRWGLGNSLV